MFFCFFRAKIWPAAAGTGELARDLRDQTRLPLVLRLVNSECQLRVGAVLTSVDSLSEPTKYHWQ